VTAVLVIADSELHAARLETSLRRDPRLRVLMADVATLARLVDDHDRLIVVVAMPTPQLARTLEIFRDLSRVPAVIVLAEVPREVWTAQARRAGVQAVLRDDATAEELTAAIAAAAAGLVVLHPDVLRAPSPPLSLSPGPGASTGLTRREMEILEAMAEGLSNRRIAARLAISRYTVKFHVASILAKLGAGSRTEAVTLGVRQGLIAL
jgi:NarL family two-component system response regulator YdfI